MTETGRAVRAAKNKITALQTENVLLRKENDSLAARVADLKSRAIDENDARELNELADILSPQKPKETDCLRVNRAIARKRGK